MSSSVTKIKGTAETLASSGIFLVEKLLNTGMRVVFNYWKLFDITEKCFNTANFSTFNYIECFYGVPTYRYRV